MSDADLQVWLDTQANIHQMVVIPYVKSAKEVQMNFRMDVIQKSGGNSSRISQQGQVHIAAEQAVPLARVALGIQKEGECQVELALREDGKDAGVYKFDCSPKS
jgi:outer membrane usher protein FimD/PapC